MQIGIVSEQRVKHGAHTFFCIDGHTCGNPVRVVTGGSIPQLKARACSSAASISWRNTTGSGPA